MTGRSVALIGDAAFVVRPQTAMGVAKAFGDVMAPQRHLAVQAELPLVLAGFEWERQQVGERIAAYGRRLGPLTPNRMYEAATLAYECAAAGPSLRFGQAC